MHVVAAAQAVAGVERMVVLGSGALLLRAPELGQSGAPLELTRDVDLWIEACDESLAAVLHEALGEGSLFDQRFGCHVDVLRPQIAETFAAGWQSRTQVVSGTTVRALSVEDVVAVKTRVGRPKDEAVVAYVLTAGLVDPGQVDALLRAMNWTEAEQREAVHRWSRLVRASR